MKIYKTIIMEEYLKRIADALERAFPLDPDILHFLKKQMHLYGSQIEIIFQKLVIYQL